MKRKTVKVLSIDIETFSTVDLLKCGVYAYASSPHFQILLFAYAFDDEEVKVIDIAAGEVIPNDVIAAIEGNYITKSAFNANFERVCLSMYLNKTLSAKSWYCTSVQAASLGLPLSLDGVAQVLGLSEQKLKEGKELIRYFSMPCNPTKTNNYRTRNYYYHDKERYDRFKNYCKRDVTVERSIRRKLAKYPISEKEHEVYILDQEINDRGVLVDINLVKNAIDCDNANKDKSLLVAQNITGLENPNSVSQLKQWLASKGIELETLSKDSIEDLLKDVDGDVAKMLNLRLQLSKTSVKKYQAIERAVCQDGRVHGLLQMYGANRTGRWAGRLVQIQNLPQNHLVDLELARNLVRSGEFETLGMLFESEPQVLSELIRTSFIPKKNWRFIVADFAAIEARVIAWLAGEKWRMNVFETHGKIYEASASQMFNVPIEQIDRTSPLRKKGKIAELGLGFGGSVGALKSMGAIEMGIEESELQILVNAWRQANPNITKLWWDVDKAAIKAVKEKTSVQLGKIRIYYESGILFIQLPSGRRLSYVKPRLQPNKFGKESITYEGIGTTKKWERIESYGPKLVENIVQGTARDLLAEAMLRLSKEGYNIVMHVHDEVIAECEFDNKSLEDMCNIMSIAPAWAEDLPLRADGFECEYYRKD